MRKNKILLAICTISLLLITSIQSLAQPSNRTSVPENIKPSSGTSMTQQALTLSLSPSQNILTLNDGNAVQQTKKETDGIVIIATLVSILSLGISFAVAYTSNLRPANIQLCFGRNLIFFPILIDIPTNSQTIKGVGFNLPVTFYNWSPKGGTIQRIRFVIGRENHDDKFYDMTWTTFVKITSVGNFDNDNLAQPIAVKGISSVNKVIRFDWISEESNSFEVKAGKYDIIIYGWTKNTKKPSLKHKASLIIEDKHCTTFNDYVAASISRPIWLSLDENEKPNQLLSRSAIERLYEY